MTFRIAQPDQAEEITALVNRAFLVEKFFIDEDRVNLDKVRRCFEHGRFLVAEDEADFWRVVSTSSRRASAPISECSQADLN